jgi:streptogramin lyase
MQPGPIIVSDQGLLFSATATCSGTGCPNYGIWKINPDGTSSRLQQTCFGVPQCRHTGLAPLATGGYCYGITHTFYQGARDPDEIVCVANHSVAEVALRALDGYLADLVLGNDGAIWYTDPQLNGIGRMDGTSHAIRANYLDPGKLYGIAAIANGPDGAMWFTAVYQNQVGRISASAFDLFTVPTTDAQPAGIVTGPDGNVWFTELNGNRIGRVTPAGVFTEFALPTAGAQPLGIIAGPDGALWFTEFNAGQIGRISRWGDITEYPVPTANAQPAGLVTGTDGNIWFTEFQGNKIGKLTVPRPSGAAQVVEFYNSDLDTFFITANAPEAAAIDNGSAGPGWSRTGGTFSAGGGTAVCRFYGSVTPGPNSHFYTADAAECESLKQLQASTPATQKRWNFESLDFNTTPAVNGACAAGLVPVYRAYNNGNVRGVDSNHRITSSTGAIAEVVRRGWSNEGVVMCAPG